ncbi:MAG: DUF1778 domain-containing protein [Woeseiaceae bacterium]|nr:DUF1778 domain-containing protein [Woeseiaceae bacterium]
MPTRATERFNLRATPEQVAKIRAAVEIGNERSLTDYILTSALTIADQRLMDRTRLSFDARAYDAFLQALEAPPRDLPRMRRLLSEPSVLEQQGSDDTAHQEAKPAEREAG